MYDDLLDHAAQNTVAADAFSTNAIQIDKTPAEGIWLEFVISRDGTDADETLDVSIFGKDTDAAWATTDDKVAVIPQIVAADLAAGGAAALFHVLVQTTHKYIKAYYDVAGTTPDYDIERWGVVSGPRRETAA